MRMAVKSPDRYVGIGLLVVCAILFSDTFTFRKTQWELLSMAFWPRLLLLLLAGFAVYLTIKGNLEPKKQVEPLAGKAFLTAAGGFVYVMLLEPIGFLILTPIFIFTFSIIISRRHLLWRTVESLTTACLGTLAVYAMFELGLNLVLPAGLLE